MRRGRFTASRCRPTTSSAMPTHSNRSALLSSGCRTTRGCTTTTRASQRSPATPAATHSPISDDPSSCFRGSAKTRAETTTSPPYVTTRDSRRLFASRSGSDQPRLRRGQNRFVAGTESVLTDPGDRGSPARSGDRAGAPEDHTRAVTLLAAAAVIRAQTGAVLTPDEHDEVNAVEQTCRQRLVPSAAGLSCVDARGPSRRLSLDNATPAHPHRRVVVLARSCRRGDRPAAAVRAWARVVCRAHE